MEFQMTSEDYGRVPELNGKFEGLKMTFLGLIKSYLKKCDAPSLSFMSIGINCQFNFKSSIAPPRATFLNHFFSRREIIKLAKINKISRKDALDGL
jgi:hypothetical protein